MSVETFPPYVYFRDELNARNWGYDKFCAASGLDYPIAKRLFDGNIEIDKELADAIAKAFVTSAEMWIDLQSEFDKSLLLELERASAKERSLEVADRSGCDCGGRACTGACKVPSLESLEASALQLREDARRVEKIATEIGAGITDVVGKYIHHYTSVADYLDMKIERRRAGGER